MAANLCQGNVIGRWLIFSTSFAFLYCWPDQQLVVLALVRTFIQKVSPIVCGRSTFQKASPWENGYVESFNGKLRDELLNRELFLSVPEARFVLDEWRLAYNHRRKSELRIDPGFQTAAG